MEKLQMKASVIRFSGKNIPITAVAKIMGKDQQFIRQAMIEGLLPIGIAFRKKGSSQYDFYVSPKLLYDYTGFFFDDDLMNDFGINIEANEQIDYDSIIADNLL